MLATAERYSSFVDDFARAVPVKGPTHITTS